MKKKHQKFKPLRELYDRDVTLLKSKDVDLLKASPESTIDQALVVDPSQDRKGDSHGKLSSSEVSNIPSTSCQSSFSDDLQSLDSLKSPGYSKDLPMLQIAITSQTTVKRQDQDVFDCQGDNSSCISKDDGAAMISSDQYGGEDHKIVTSRAVSVSSPYPDVLEKSLNVLSISKGSPIASTQDPCLQNQNLMHEDRADEPDELVDVRICDICGDAGREASLALCSKCSDGAEHIYCMSPKMDKVSEGDWFCEECLLMQDPKRQRQVMMEGPDDAPNSSRIQEPSQGSPTIISAIHHDGKMKTNHSSKASCSSDKRPGLAIDVRSKAKKGIDDRSAQPLKISDSGGNSRLTHRSSLKNMNEKKNASRQVSSFVVPDNKMVKQGSSEHRSSKPEQQSCGGSFTDKKIVDSSVSNLEVQHSREDIHQRRRSTEDKADCELKKDHPDKKVVESLSLAGASSMPPEVSNMQSSVSNIKGVRYGNKSNIAEKNCSLESKTNQVDFPSAGSSPTNVRSSCAKVAPQIGKAASSPIKSFEDKSAIQVNGNTNVEAFDSLALEGKNRVNTSAGSVEESNSPNCASYVINSPAKNVNAYPDLRMSLSTQKAELAEIKRNNNDVSSFTVQHMKVKPTIDPVNLDHMAPNLTSAVPESRCIWRGTFSLEKSGKLPTDCYGVQAHLSTRASSKIADLVLKFSDELLLKEVPRLHTWPIQFQKNNPNEQDIALYFFAQDLCSYERSYRMLLEGMSTNDIALEANFGGF
ncbi:uncharacterized protein LOC110730189 [Chenopodium quinoa]|uniref:uncharacterized protein LOC110730189 n=1 Tax=Chenopodium quinoa TaxID=63459 RepID=UPI000B76D8AA|nr:uncharacterized protein LOC110730189 [Chenopodium quinoa]